MNGTGDPRIESSEYSGQYALGALGLLALMIFFVSQSSINSFMIPIGRDLGLRTEDISRLLATGLFSGLIGAVAARLLGERLGLLLPVAAIALVLGSMFSLLTSTRSPVFFMCSAILLPSCTIFVVPYFFTWLAMLDRSGRYSSVGPAFLLSGVALGPALAVLISSKLGFRALGTLATSGMVLATLVFGWSHKLRSIERLRWKELPSARP